MVSIQEALTHKFLNGLLEHFVSDLNKFSPVYEDSNYPGARGNVDFWNDLLICGTNACSRLRDKYDNFRYDANINRFYKSMEIINNFEPGTIY